VAQDTFYVGTLKGVGRVYQQTAIDTYSKVAFAKLYDRKTPLTAADLMNDRVVPFFERFPLVGQKARDFELFKSAVALLSKPGASDDDYVAILQLREGMNRGGKRRYSTTRILRDYTPTSPLDAKR